MIGTTCALTCLTLGTLSAISSAFRATFSRSLSGAVTLTKTIPSFAEAFTLGNLLIKAASTSAAKVKLSREV